MKFQCPTLECLIIDNMKTVSFCITSCYKDIHHLQKLLEEIKKQTIAPNDIIIYCSGIPGIQIQSSLMVNNTEVSIKTIVDKQPQLQTVARNVCARQSKNDIIIFFDVDDIPHPQKIEATMKYIEDYDFLMHSYTQHICNFENIDILNIKHTDDLNIDPNPASTNIYATPDGHITHGHLTVKKHVFDKLEYDENFYHVNSFGQKFCSGEDGKFCQDLIKNNFKGIFLDEPLIIYT